MFIKVLRIHFLFIILATICYQNQPVWSTLQTTTTSYRENTIGCLFSDVCNDKEVCFDDHAFGRCEKLDPRTGSFLSDYTYQMDRKTLQLLEQELIRLSMEGYDWPDPYTQCVLKAILNDRPRIVYDPSACDKFLFLQSINVGDNEWLDSNSVFTRPPTKFSNSNDLFLTLSKYFKPSKSSEVNKNEDKENPQPKHLAKTNNQNLNKESLSLIPSSGPSSSSNSLTSNKYSQQISSSSNKSENLDSTGNNSDSLFKEQPQHIDLLNLIPNMKEKQNMKFISFNDKVTSNNEAENRKRKTKKKSMENFFDRFNNVERKLIDSSNVKMTIDENQPRTNLENFDNNNNYDNNVDFNIERNKELIEYLKTLVVNSNINNDYNDFLLDNDDRFDYNNKKENPQENDYENLIKLVGLSKNDNGKLYDSNQDQPTEEFYNPNNNDWEYKQHLRPLMSVLKVPEVRVIRDTNEETNYDDPDQLDLDFLENPLNEDIVLVDLEEDNNNGNVDIDNNNDMDILNRIFKWINDDKRLKSDAEDDDIENINEDDDNDNEKEILIGDINYSNNYLMPNFYRNHRYDIKKPGPMYVEDYFFRKSNPEDEEMPRSKDKNEENLKNTNEKNYQNPMKKDFSIRSNQPVAEGPVKLDAKSENTLIIRSAAEGERTNFEAIDSTHTYVVTDKMLNEEDSEKFLQTIEQAFNLPRGTFSNLRKEDYQITFKVNPNYLELNASQVASKIEDSAKLIKKITGYTIKETGIGDKIKLPVVSATLIKQSNEKLIRMTLLVCTIILSIISGAFITFLFRRNTKFREKIKGFMKLSEDWLKFDYQELCRQRFQKKNNTNNNNNDNNNNDKDDVEKRDSQDSKDHSSKNMDTNAGDYQGTNPPSRSSTSSYVEEPVSSNMDITTGHIILSYMEDHLKKKDRLDCEWEALCAYEADPCSTNAALQKQNANKNRYLKFLPFDHSRVILNDSANVMNSDYINANTITDYDPRNPAYIASQGPLPNTKADFWQMIWEQGSVLIVMLTRLRENGLNMCDRYWPEEGSEMFHNYEVHLVSEHIWCDDYLVRSFYLKNLKTAETRTVTQFHFLSWPENGIPSNIKSVLDFRRKVNKSYKGRSCPIVVHCNDGCGRTGTYILIDMVLNRLAKGAKEIDIAATLEHIRDQRYGMVKTKAQFEFVLLAVADEVQAILKALSN